MKLIVGLANPGKEYAQTRHNAGAWFVEQLAQEANVHLRMEIKFHGLHAQAHLHGLTAHLLIPTTFMNLSGQAVRACMNYNKCLAQEILVAHDDIDLPVGTVKLKFGGGDGGHNGLKDIIRHLNTKDFYRLRIGVGRPHRDTVDYVLSVPPRAERQQIDEALTRAQHVMLFVLEDKIEHAMQALHTKEEGSGKNP